MIINMYNTDTQSDTTDIRLISVHVLRTELEVSMGSAAGGQPPPPQILEESFSIKFPPTQILTAFVVKFLTL